MALSSLLSVRDVGVIVHVVLASFVVSHFELCLVLGRFRVEEQVIVGVAIISNFGLPHIAVKEGEVGVCAGSEALRSALAVIADLLVKNVVPKHSYCSHRADWPE